MFGFTRSKQSTYCTQGVRELLQDQSSTTREGLMCLPKIDLWQEESLDSLHKKKSCHLTSQDLALESESGSMHHKRKSLSLVLCRVP